jgi:glycosyltransferase involved in cell wall biosynthesis
MTSSHMPQADRSMPPVTSLVVLSRFVSDRTGTGQRSRLLVEAACQCGPTHVVIVNDNDHALAQIPVFPGAASVTVLDGQPIDPTGPFGRLAPGLARLFFPRRSYAARPALRAALLRIAERTGAETVSFRYIALFRAAGLGVADGLRVIVDVDDRDDQKYRVRLATRLGPRLARLWPLGALCDRLERLLRIWLTEASAAWFAADEDVWPMDGVETVVLPNVPYWSARADTPPPSTAPETIVFVGVHGYKPNRDGVVWFLEHCWPQIVKERPNAQFRVIGSGAWDQLAPRYATVPGVTFVGMVDDLAAEYAQARLAICPVYEGGGSKIKVVEAASFARPAVVTTHALRGFKQTQTLDVPQTNDPASFAKACIAFLEDSARADRAGKRLWTWQQTTYSRAAFVKRAAQSIRNGMSEDGDGAGLAPSRRTDTRAVAADS